MSKIERWAERHELGLDEVDSFVSAMRAMDRVWLEAANAPADGQQDVVSERPFSLELFDAKFG